MKMFVSSLLMLHCSSIEITQKVIRSVFQYFSFPYDLDQVKSNLLIYLGYHTKFLEEWWLRNSKNESRAVLEQF